MNLRGSHQVLKSQGCSIERRRFCLTYDGIVLKFSPSKLLNSGVLKRNGRKSHEVVVKKGFDLNVDKAFGVYSGRFFFLALTPPIHKPRRMKIQRDYTRCTRLERKAKTFAESVRSDPKNHRLKF